MGGRGGVSKGENCPGGLLRKGGGSKGENCPGGLLRRGVQNERNFQKGHSSNDEIMANAQCSEKFR